MKKRKVKCCVCDKILKGDSWEKHVKSNRHKSIMKEAMKRSGVIHLLTGVEE